MIPTPAPTVSTNGVVLPLPLAIALFHCYFGDGPRYRQSPSPEGEPSEPIATPEIAPRPPVKDELNVEQLMMALQEKEGKWTPKGNAALREGPKLGKGAKAVHLEFGGSSLPEK